MESLELKSDPRVADVYENYPKLVRPKIEYLRKLIIDTANDTGEISSITETLKWGEPSFLVNRGSTLRMDWKPKNPNQYAMYFKCTSKLVSTFKSVYGKTFNYENNRAIVFQLEDEVPVRELKECIRVTLTYHKVKHLPLLGLK